MKKILLLSLFGCCVSESSFSQGGSTGIGTTTPHASSVLDVNSNNKGVLFPRVSTTQRMGIVNPAMGLMVYDTDKRAIFLYDGAQWLPMLSGATNANILPQTIAPPDLESGDRLGMSVSIFGDYAVAGCPAPGGTGKAYVYFRNAGMWTQQAVLTASDGASGDEFGTAVAINGNYAIVGAPKDDVITGTPPFIFNYENKGSVYIFVRSGSTWTQQAKLVSAVTASFQYYGISVSLEGNHLAVGAIFDTDAGAVYIYQQNGNIWDLQQKLVSSDGVIYDQFGYSIDLANNYIIVGANVASPTGAAYIFFFNGIFWMQQQKITTSGTDFEQGSSVSINDTIALVGRPNASSGEIYIQGAANFYRRTGTTWSSMGSTIYAPDGVDQAHFGISLSLYGGYAIIGARKGAGPLPGDGTAYIYKKVGNFWQFQQKINDPTLLTDEFGYAVAIDGFNLIIGSPYKANLKGGVAFLNIQ